MKKIKMTLLLSFMLALTTILVACGNKDAFTIQFNSNGGSAVTSIGVKNLYDHVDKPTDPTRNEYDFAGWYYDAEFSNIVTWPFQVDKDYLLYAKWIPNVINLRLNDDVVSWKNFDDATYTLMIDDTIISSSYTSNFYTITNDYKDGYNHNVQIKYNNIIENVIYKFEKANSVNDLTNMVVDDSLLKWTWINNNDEFSFNGFKIFINGEFYSKQYAPQLVLPLIVDIENKKTTYKIEIFATAKNGFDSNVIKYIYDYANSQHTITLDYKDETTQSQTLTTINNKIVLPIPTRQGYTFIGWYSSNNLGETLIRRHQSTDLILKNTIFYAEWLQNIEVQGKVVLDSPVVELIGDSIYWSQVTNANGYIVRVEYNGEDGFTYDEHRIYEREFNFKAIYDFVEQITIKIKAVGDGVSTVNSAEVSRTINYATYYPNVVGQVNYDANIGVLYWNTGMTEFDIKLKQNNDLIFSTETTLPEVYMEDNYPSGQLKLQVNGLTTTVTNYRLSTPSYINVMSYNNHYYIETNYDINADKVKVYKNGVFSFQNDSNYIHFSKDTIQEDAEYELVFADSSSTYFTSKFITIDFNNLMSVKNIFGKIITTDDNRILFFGNLYHFYDAYEQYFREDIIDITNLFNLECEDEIVDVFEKDLSLIILTKNGRVFVWGDNEYGQLATGDTQNKTTPTEITERFDLGDDEIITSFGADKYGNTFMTITSLGRVFVWGSNNGYILTNIETEYILTPMLLSSKLNLKTGDKVIYYSLDENIIITKFGDFFRWDYSETYNTPKNAIKTNIANGENIKYANDTYVVSESGKLYLPHYIENNLYFSEWNLFSDTELVTNAYDKIVTTSLDRILSLHFSYAINSNGELGLGNNDFYTGIVDLTSIISLDAEEEFVNINIKYSTFSYATTSLGKLYVWGNNSIRAPYLITFDNPNEYVVSVNNNNAKTNLNNYYSINYLIYSL